MQSKSQIKENSIEQFEMNSTEDEKERYLLSLRRLQHRLVIGNLPSNDVSIKNLIYNELEIFTRDLNRSLALLAERDYSFLPAVLYLIEMGVKPSKDPKEYRKYQNDHHSILDSELPSYIVFIRDRPLLDNILHADSSFKEVVIKHLPERIAELLKDLAFVAVEMRKEYSWETNTSWQVVDQARLTLLLELKPEHGYQASDNDKRLIEKFLLGEIKNCKSEDELDKLNEKYGKLYLFEQRRNETYDKFRKFIINTASKPTRLKQEYDKALENKRNLLSDQVSSSYSDQSKFMNLKKS